MEPILEQIQNQKQVVEFSHNFCESRLTLSFMIQRSLFNILISLFLLFNSRTIEQFFRVQVFR